MKFSEIVDHLGKRGFTTRKSWEGRCVLFWGMDNTAYISGVNDKVRECSFWDASLADILADDWEIIDCFWGCKKADGEPWDTDNYMPWTKGLMKVVTIVRE